MAKAERGERPVWFAGKWHATRVWSRLDLPAGAVIESPAILEQPDATVFIEPGLRGRVDTLGNVIVERSASSLQNTALLLLDLQNDFLHPQGAYARAGQTSAAIAALPARLKPLADAVRQRGGLVAATLFTLVPGRSGEPIVSPHLKKLRPFLGKGDSRRDRGASGWSMRSGRRMSRWRR